MPLVHVTHRPSFEFTKIGGSPAADSTEHIVRRMIGPELPALFAGNSAAFGMGESVPETGVQVRFHRYGPDDINVADLWVLVLFSEDPPSVDERVRIRHAVWDALVDKIHAFNLTVPDNFMLDVLWGPTSGCGSVNGTLIEW